MSTDNQYSSTFAELKNALEDRLTALRAEVKQIETALKGLTATEAILGGAVTTKQ